MKFFIGMCLVIMIGTILNIEMGPVDGDMTVYEISYELAKTLGREWFWFLN